MRSVITAKLGDCCWNVSTISSCRVVNSGRCLVNSEAPTGGEICLAAGVFGVSSNTATISGGTTAAKGGDTKVKGTEQGQRRNPRSSRISASTSGVGSGTMIRLLNSFASQKPHSCSITDTRYGKYLTPGVKPSCLMV
jgi:hypothetical protein